MKNSNALDSFDFALIKLNDVNVTQKKSISACFLKLEFSILVEDHKEFMEFMNIFELRFSEKFLFVRNAKRMREFNFVISKIVTHFQCPECFIFNINAEHVLFLKEGRMIDLPMNLKKTLIMDLVRKYWIDENLGGHLIWRDYSNHQITSKMLISKESGPILELLGLKNSN